MLKISAHYNPNNSKNAHALTVQVEITDPPTADDIWSYSTWAGVTDEMVAEVNQKLAEASIITEIGSEAEMAGLNRGITIWLKNPTELANIQQISIDAEDLTVEIDGIPYVPSD